MAKTIQQLQTFVDSNPDERHLINEIVDYLQANPAGGGSVPAYLCYVAIINQSSTNPPVATVLNSNDSNYLGDIVWARDSVGNYIGTLDDAFPQDRTFITISNTSGVSIVSYSAGLSGAPDTVFIITEVNDVFADDQLMYAPLEVRVYPA